MNIWGEHRFRQHNLTVLTKQSKQDHKTKIDLWNAMYGFKREIKQQAECGKQNKLLESNLRMKTY